MCDDCSESTSTSDTSCDTSSDTSCDTLTDTGTDTTAELPEDTDDLSNDGSEGLPDDSGDDLDCDGETEADDCSEEVVEEDPDSAESAIDTEEDIADDEKVENQDNIDESVYDNQDTSANDTPENDLSEFEIEKSVSDDLYPDDSEKLPDGDGISNETDSYGTENSDVNSKELPDGRKMDYLSTGSNDLYGADRTAKDDYSIKSLRDDLDRMRNEQYAQEDYMNSTYPDDIDSRNVIYNRLADQYSGIADKYTPTYENLQREKNNLQMELDNYRGTDQNYITDTKARINQLNGDIDSYRSNIGFANNVANDMRVGEQTEFNSVNGKDFTNSYDNMISKQHDSDCGVCSYSNSKGQVKDLMPNEQKEFQTMRNNGTCDSSGGTTESTIRKQCQADGLMGETIRKPSATQVHDLVRNGDGCMIALKSDHLKSGGNLPKGEADHFVNVVGSEYNKQGEPIGFWVNNSNRCTGTNKVYLSNDRFNSMVGRTGGFFGSNPITATCIRSK